MLIKYIMNYAYAIFYIYLIYLSNLYSIFLSRYASCWRLLESQFIAVEEGWGEHIENIQKAQQTVLNE